MKKLILVSIIIFLSLFAEKLFPQNGVNEEDKISITQELKTIYGFDYEISDIVNVDSVENIYDSEFGMIDDPYGTLQDCLLFTANRKQAGVTGNYSSIVGIFKNNQIIWRSDIILPESFTYGEIFGSVDLNNDGKVDIITKWNDNQNKEIDLWIYEWDGSNGTIINEYSEFGSAMYTSEYTSFKFPDFEGDGIWEIVGSEPTSTDPTFFNLPIDYQLYVYSWNGIKYTYSRTLEMNSLEIFFPRTKFTAQIKTTIQKREQGFFKYNYLVKNDPSSIQYINKFDIYSKMDSITNKINYNISSPVGWENFLFYSEISWSDDIDNFISVLKFKNKIKPGTELDNFSFEAQGLPSIVEVYLRGLNYDLAQGDDNYNRVDDYINNSVIDTTVGPSKISFPFIPLNFIDTLINYNQHSSDLGWITNQETADKYDSLFTLAKIQLQQNNNNAAKTTLQTVLQEVDIDSTNNLTSEAYALLRYNTEYLLEQIPQSSPNLLVTLKNSLGNQIPASNVQYYEGGWKDAVNNGDGTFTVITTKPAVSVRVYYEYASLQADNVNAQNNTYTFQTVNAAVQLKNSLGNLIDLGTVQYYAGAWRTFGTTTNGIANKELLPITYSFRMTYEYVSNDKQQNLSTNPVVDFNTVLCSVKVSKTSNNQPINNAEVKYYSGAWRNLGTTNTDGIASKELLPANLSFRASYGNVSLDKQQDITVNNLVEILLNVP